MIHQIFEIISRDEAEIALKKFEIADEIFDFDDFTTKIQSDLTEENCLIHHVMTEMIQDMMFLNDQVDRVQDMQVQEVLKQ